MRTISSAEFCQNLSKIWFPHLAKKCDVLGYCSGHFGRESRHSDVRICYFQKKAKQFHWSGLENWPGLHRRQCLIQTKDGEKDRDNMPGDTRNLQTALLICVEEIVPGKKFQKINSTIHHATKIFSCTAQQKDALLKY